MELNPWWKGPFVEDSRPRELETALGPFLPVRMMLGFTGLRRSGKTTLMLRLAKQAIEGGLDPRRVVYFSFDVRGVESLRDVVTAWESIAHQSRNEGRVLLLLDEVQKLEGWAEQAKVLYDRYRNFKFLLSGSESLFIRRGLHESLAGRLFEFEVGPLSFREYLDFAGVRWDPLSLHRREVGRALDGFVACQGFPELVHSHTPNVVRKYVQENVLEKVAYRDLPELIGLTNPGAIESIMRILMDDPGQILDVAGLGADVGLSSETAAAYLRYLEQSFLLRKLYNWSANRRKVERKLKKYYPTLIDPILASSRNDALQGKVLEWLLVTQAKASFFWRDPYKHEVDMVLDGPLPVEVKLRRVDASGLAAFFRKHKARQGTVVTLEQEGTIGVEGRTVEVVPAYEFLLRLPPHEA